MSEQQQRSIGHIKALAAYLHALRPGWDELACCNQLAKASEQHPWPQVEAAALKAVRSDRAQTPAAIGFPEQYPAPDRDAYHLTARACSRCRGWVVPAVPHVCAHDSDWQTGIALLRQAFHAGKGET